MIRTKLALTMAATGLMACGGDSGDVRTVTVTETPAAQETPTPVPAGGDPILIENRIADARKHDGEVADGSVIGEKPFCRGGRSTGGSDGPTITSTFRCPGGTLKVQFAPTQRSLVQGSVWEVVSGTGDYEGLRGGGSMVASFEEDDSGREIFTGTVGK